MKKILLTSLAILATGLILILLFFPISFSGKNTIHIALMGPMSGPDKISGEDGVKGILMCLDEINKEGGIRGRKIKLLTYDDKNDKRTAMEVAYQVAEEEKVLLVIGHYRSTVSIDAGKVYKRTGIPAITAFATTGSVTSGNEWYFRTVPNNALYADFIANYISKILKKTTASIILVNNAYGLSLAGAFEKAARKLGIRIIKKWSIDAAGGRDSEEQLARIAEELKATEDPGILFFATSTYSPEAAKIIISIKYRDTAYSVIGATSLSGGSFLNNLREYSPEGGYVSYLSDGIYAASPFLADIGNEKAYTFRQKFLKEYGEEPSLTATCAYDAAYVAVEAIKNAETEGRGDIREDRRKVREALTTFYDYESAVRGVTGAIYFDKNGDAPRPPAIGIYENENLRPLFSQYHLTDISTIDNPLKELLSGELIEIDGQAMRKTRVIYVGMRINEIRNLNVRNSVCTLDFYLWFFYEGEFDDREITFLNAVKPVTLGQPISDIKRGNVTARVYHVTADFRNDPDFRMYPFDQHVLKIELRHSRLTRDKLILATEVSRVGAAKKIRLDAAAGWAVRDTSFYQDIIVDTSLGDPLLSDSQDAISYSRINAAVRIERKGLSFVFKNFLPVIIMIITLYVIYFIPPDRFGFRAMVFMAVLIATVYYRMTFLSEFPTKYLCVIEYAFFTVYILVILAALISIPVYILCRKGAGKKERFFNRAGIIIHPCIVLASMVFAYIYIS